MTPTRLRELTAALASDDEVERRVAAHDLWLAEQHLDVPVEQSADPDHEVESAEVRRAVDSVDTARVEADHAA